MVSFAVLRDADISAQKVRCVAQNMKGQAFSSALVYLSYMPKKAARLLHKVLASAGANAEHQGADARDLYIFGIAIDGARMLKRVSPRAKGRSDRILKRRCHIKIVLATHEAAGERV